MKRLMMIMMLACTCSIIHAQEALFKKYSNTKGVETIYISKTLLSLMPKSALGDKDVSQIAGKLEQIRILDCENKDLIPEIKKDAENFYKKEKYEVAMENNEEGERTVIYIRKIKKQKNEFVIFQQEKKELQIISIIGDITLEDIKNLKNLNM
ncbi:MAG: DUF4252 domain-containing protein [Prevotella sp.]|nr:DUF4252 domain-containing protein [Prevotella sp.]